MRRVVITEAAEELRRFARENGIPVVSTLMGLEKSEIECWSACEGEWRESMLQRQIRAQFSGARQFRREIVN
jgi:hypothetical protein